MEGVAAHLKETICKKVSPADDEWQAFIQNWEPFTFPKNHILTDFEETEEYFYFVHEGVIRAYFEKGAEEFNIGFSYQVSSAECMTLLFTVSLPVIASKRSLPPRAFGSITSISRPFMTSTKFSSAGAGCLTR